MIPDLTRIIMDYAYPTRFTYMEQYLRVQTEFHAIYNPYWRFNAFGIDISATQSLWYMDKYGIVHWEEEVGHPGDQETFSDA